MHSRFAPVSYLLLAVVIFCGTSSIISADDGYVEQMKLLIKSAGQVPEAIIYPPRMTKQELTLSDRLDRFWREKVLGFRITYASARGKACQANQRVILGAVEMYNLDNKNSLKGITNRDVADPSATLVTARYLKSPITLPEIDCHYLSYGDLTDGGIVYCTQHGTIKDYQQALIKAGGFKIKEQEADDLMIYALVGMFLFTVVTSITVFAVRSFGGGSKKQIE